MSKQIEKSLTENEELKRKTLGKLIETRGIYGDNNSRLKAEAQALAQEIENRGRSVQDAKVKGKASIKELGEKINAEAAKEKSFRDNKEKLAASISKCNETVLLRV